MITLTDGDLNANSSHDYAKKLHHEKENEQ
jgi:hypothetical protein